MIQVLKIFFEKKLFSASDDQLVQQNFYFIALFIFILDAILKACFFYFEENPNLDDTIKDLRVKVLIFSLIFLILLIIRLLGKVRLLMILLFFSKMLIFMINLEILIRSTEFKSCSGKQDEIAKTYMFMMFGFKMAFFLFFFKIPQFLDKIASSTLIIYLFARIFILVDCWDELIIGTLLTLNYVTWSTLHEKKKEKKKNVGKFTAFKILDYLSIFAHIHNDPLFIFDNDYNIKFKSIKENFNSQKQNLNFNLEKENLKKLEIKVISRTKPNLDITETLSSKESNEIFSGKNIKNLSDLISDNAKSCPELYKLQISLMGTTYSSVCFRIPFLTSPPINILSIEINNFNNNNNINNNHTGNGSRHEIKVIAECPSNNFVSFVAHEIRTPLNCIINMLNFLEQNLQDENLVIRYLIPAVTSSKFLVSMANDLLDSAQIQAGTFKVTIVDFNIEQVIAEIIKLFELQAKNRGVAIEVHEENMVSNIIRSDPIRIKQILTNLLNNALKFTSSGSIIIDLISVPPLLRFSVTDTGIGIRADDQKRLFRAFGKVSNPESEALNSQGVGLGLLISNNLAYALSPSIDESKKGLHVQSEYGTGSTFYFYVEDQMEGWMVRESMRTLETEENMPLRMKNPFGKALEEKKNRKEILTKTLVFKIGSRDSISRETLDPSQINFPKARKLTTSSFALNNTELRNGTINSHNISEGSSKTPQLNFNFERKSYFTPDWSISDSSYKPFFVSDDEKESFITEIKNRKKNCNCPEILICDDEYFNILVLENYLQEIEIKCDKAINGVDCLEKLNAFFEKGNCCKRFKAVFLDLEMPFQDGFLTFKIMQDYFEKKKSEIPVIIAQTAYDGQEITEKVLKSGMDYFLHKPISKESLMAVIKKIGNLFLE